MEVVPLSRRMRVAVAVAVLLFALAAVAPVASAASAPSPKAKQSAGAKAKAKARAKARRHAAAKRRHQKQHRPRPAATPPAETTAAGPAPPATPPPNPPAAIAGCAGANLQPNAANLDRVRDATLCLINQERAKAGLGALSEQPQLEHAAGDQVGDMLARNFYGHVNPDGRSPLDRITADGYLQGAR